MSTDNISSFAYLSEALTDLSGSLLGATNPSSSSLNFAIDSQLDRVDQLSTHINVLRTRIDNTTDNLFPELASNVQEIKRLFATIELINRAVDRVHEVATVAANRLEKLQEGYNTRYPEGFAKMASLFTSRNRVSDQPVTLPPFDPSKAIFSSASAMKFISSQLSPEVVGEGGPWSASNVATSTVDAGAAYASHANEGGVSHAQPVYSEMQAEDFGNITPEVTEEQEIYEQPDQVADGVDGATEVAATASEETPEPEHTESSNQRDEAETGAAKNEQIEAEEVKDTAESDVQEEQEIENTAEVAEEKVDDAPYDKNLQVGEVPSVEEKIDDENDETNQSIDGSGQMEDDVQKEGEFMAVAHVEKNQNRGGGKKKGKGKRK